MLQVSPWLNVTAVCHFAFCSCTIALNGCFVAFLAYFTLLCVSLQDKGFPQSILEFPRSLWYSGLFLRAVNQLFLLAIDVMLLATSNKMLLKSCCGLQCWGSCSSHLKIIRIPLFKIFLPSNIGRITLYPPDVIILEMHLLFREVCLFLSFTSIENIIKSTFTMFLSTFLTASSNFPS